jgi:hypothetical protein
MDDSDLLFFAPVKLRGRRDGWTARRQRFFILGLARGFPVGKAAAILGMTRKTAYELRARAGAEGFAEAWRAALEWARERRRAAGGPSLAERALHGEWHPQLRDRRLVGWVRRDAGMRLVGLLKRLDSAIERNPPAPGGESLESWLATLSPERDDPDGGKPIGRKFRNVPPLAGGT